MGNEEEFGYEVQLLRSIYAVTNVARWNIDWLQTPVTKYLSYDPV